MTKTLLMTGLLLLGASPAWAQNTVVPGEWAQDLGWATGPQDYNSANASGIPGYWINGGAPRTRPLQSEAYAPMAYQSCNPNVVAITDEYGFKYNCRGARLR
ncbi:MAG TPA: hypothetical protein VKY24_12270 [Reyranella sp.]|nr:hypothetical protein [Reyranella sp.]